MQLTRLAVATAACALEAVACAAPAPRAPEGAALFRAGVALEQDFGMVYGSGICDMDSQLEGGFACFRANGTQYHGTPLRDEGASPQGTFPATTRLLIGLDRVVFERLALGVRGGVVLSGGGPKPDGAGAPSFLPFHGEARATYWLGAAPFAGQGFRIGVFAGGGVAQVDTALRVLVEEDTRAPAPAAQPSNPALQTLDAYKKAGTGFFSGGVAAALAPSRTSAFFLNLKVMQLFPSAGTAVAPEIGYEHGF
jgi:hypothetical protein